MIFNQGDVPSMSHSLVIVVSLICRPGGLFPVIEYIQYSFDLTGQVLCFECS